jgi:hypothetical protein
MSKLMLPVLVFLAAIIGCGHGGDLANRTVPDGKGVIFTVTDGPPYSLPSAPPGTRFLLKKWTPIDLTKLGTTISAITAKLGHTTCGDALENENFPGEEILTFAHDGSEYRVHTKAGKPIRAYRSSIEEVQPTR